MRIASIIFLTICYSAIWVSLLFIVVGFFMPNPVRFNRKIRGIVVPYNKDDDRYMKEALYYDMIDDD